MIFGNEDRLKEILANSDRKIVVYGAGMIGQVIVPYLVEANNLCDRLICYFDADSNKQKLLIDICGHKYSVRKPEAIRLISEETVVLVTNSNFTPIVEMLDGMAELDNNEAFILPILNAVAVHNQSSVKVNLRKTVEPLIPKKIHYCWFSGNPMPDYLLKCIESWERLCPDYEIVRWDESNYDVTKNLYMKQAYEAGKWGFVPDIARLDILYNHGGIYLDTDVEMVKRPDELLYQKGFAGVEKWGNVNMGGCSGAVAGHPMIKRMLDFRKNEKFVKEDGSMNVMTCGFYETLPFIELGMKPDNTVQEIGDMTIYSSEFFHPYDYMSCNLDRTENTFSIHHFNGGWLDAGHREERQKTSDNYHKMLDRMRDTL